jgi:OOP family OmpA-OmpF porin
MKKQLIALALTGMSVMSIAQADQYLDNRFYVSPFGTYVMPDGNRDVKDAWGAGLGVGKIINEHFNVELKGFYQNFRGGYANTNPGYLSRGGQWQMAGGLAELQYHFMRNALNQYKVSPYAVMGVGAATNWVPNADAISLVTEAGIGATYELMDNLLLRADVRYRYMNDFHANLANKADMHHDMVVNAGVVVPFGPKPTAAVAVAEPVTPPPVDPCSFDDDHDGVNNCVDKCPNTLAGAEVDPVGCPKVVELKGVQFKYDSAELTSNAQGVLDNVARDLIASSQGKDIEVQGHTSSEGSDAYNMRLSQRRSQSVVNYLKAHGVKDRLYAKGYGETRLKVRDGKDEALRAINRRVELHWAQ